MSNATILILNTIQCVHYLVKSAYLPTYLPTCSPCCTRRHIGEGLELSTLLYPELSSLFIPRLSSFPLVLPPQFTSKLSLGGPSFFSLLGSILKILSNVIHWQSISLVSLKFVYFCKKQEWYLYLLLFWKKNSCLVIQCWLFHIKLA